MCNRKKQFTADAKLLRLDEKSIDVKSTEKAKVQSFITNTSGFPCRSFILQIIFLDICFKSIDHKQIEIKNDDIEGSKIIIPFEIELGKIPENSTKFALKIIEAVLIKT